MEDSKIPRFVFLIPLIALLTLSVPFVWQDKLTAEKLGKEEFVLAPRVARQLPIISARSAIILDPSSGNIIFSKNPNLRFTPASTTKIMTALVALNHYKTNEVLTVSKLDVIGSKIYLLPGEQITVENLLYGLLLNSGNDAAYTLAQNFPGGIKGFVEEMNNTARTLNLTNTYFTDPAGLNDDGNYTTALDLTRLAKEALKNPVFTKIVATREKTVLDVTGKTSHKLTNLNRLLWDVPGVIGVKTGFTQKAGGVLVTLLKNEKQFIFVVFKSDDRFADTKSLIKFTLHY